MAKVGLEKIFKNGKDFKFKHIDYSHHRNQKRLIRIKKKQIMADVRMNVSISEMQGIVINI